MKLEIKNIGKVRSASVYINGITVIAGENDTGKSTIGKVLYAVFNSLHHIDKTIKKERLEGIEKQIFSISHNLSSEVDEYEVAQEILNQISECNTKDICTDNVRNILNSWNEKNNEIWNSDEINAVSVRIVDLLMIPDQTIYNDIMQKTIDAEFNGQSTTIFSDGVSHIRLMIKKDTLNINIVGDDVINIDKRWNMMTEVLYFDDPFVLDEASSRFRVSNGLIRNHRTHLRNLLAFDGITTNLFEEAAVTKKLQTIYSKISEVCEGEIIKEKSTPLNYRLGNSNKTLSVRNLSTGLKTFVILKRLLKCGYIEENGTIILDEPEIHLHPEWQLVFAELIVLLQKEFNLHILLNTHSPYFLNAIEVYSVKHGITERCNYYLAENDGAVSEIFDVSDNIEEIYRKLAVPMQKLENERYRYEET